MLALLIAAALLLPGGDGRPRDSVELEGGAKLRPRFFDYLREACKGHSSSTAFKDELKLEESAMAKSWVAFVRTTAGTKR